MGRLRIVPITLKHANAMVDAFHRHHSITPGHKFSIGVEENGVVVGAAICGRPVARGSNDGYTCEVTRLVTVGTPNACSMLYAACARAGKAMGYDLIQTYILEDEKGNSLKAAGWEFDGLTAGGAWKHSAGPRKNIHPLCPKQRWICRLTERARKRKRARIQKKRIR